MTERVILVGEDLHLALTAYARWVRLPDEQRTSGCVLAIAGEKFLVRRNKRSVTVIEEGHAA